MSKAMEKALNEVADAFRPERKQAREQVLLACRLKELVQNHCFTFWKAVEKLEANPDRIKQSFAWLVIDSFELNKKYETTSHTRPLYEFEAIIWLTRLTGEP